MSWKIAALCDERRFGSPSRKQVIMYLADKASDDGAGIWCSKYTIARHTELSLATVKRIVREFIHEGILVETGRRQCERGFTVVFRISIGAIECLESLKETVASTGVTVNPVQDDPPTRVTMNPAPGSPRPPNHPKTIPEPPPCIGPNVSEEEEAIFDQIMKAYPEDRRRGEADCLAAAMHAIMDGYRLEELRDAVKLYAAETADFSRSRVCFSDNWFRTGRWKKYIHEVRGKHREAGQRYDAQLANVARWIKTRSAMCRHISARQARDAIAKGLVQRDEVTAAGVTA